MASLEFFKSFHSRCSQLLQNISEIPAYPSPEYQLALQSIADLEKEIENATYLVPYDVRKYNENMKEARAALGKRQLALKPKTKFSFKTKTKGVEALGKTGSAESSAAAVESVLTEEQLELIRSGGMIESLNNLCYVHQSESGKGARDLVVQNCKDSIIDLTRLEVSLSTVHIVNCVHCVLISKPISGTCFIDNFSSSFLAMAAHQLRIHNSEGLDVYGHITSQPIIENCKGIRMFRYPGVLSEEEGLLKANLKGPNLFNKVLDFMWVQETPSPHWCEPKEEEVTEKLDWNLYLNEPQVAMKQLNRHWEQ